MDNQGDFIVRLIKEASGLEGEIRDCKITLRREPVLNFRKLLRFKLKQNHEGKS